MMDRTHANANQVIASMPHPTHVLMTMNARQTKIVPTMMDRTHANANQVIASMPHPTHVLMTMSVLRTLVDPHKPVAAPTFQDPSAVTATKDTSTTQTTRNALTLMNASILFV